MVRLLDVLRSFTGTGSHDLSLAEAIEPDDPRARSGPSVEFADLLEDARQPIRSSGASARVTAVLRKTAVHDGTSGGYTEHVAIGRLTVEADSWCYDRFELWSESEGIELIDDRRAHSGAMGSS